MAEENQPQQSPEVPSPEAPKPEEQKPEPERGLSTTMGILITLLVAVIVGGGVWTYFNYYVLPDVEKSASEVQITIPKKTSEKQTQESTTTSTKSPKQVVGDFMDEYKKCTSATGDCKEVMERYAILALVNIDWKNADWLGLQERAKYVQVDSLSETIYEDNSARVILDGTWTGVPEGAEGSNFDRHFILIKLDNQWKIAFIEDYNPFPSL